MHSLSYSNKYPEEHELQLLRPKEQFMQLAI